MDPNVLAGEWKRLRGRAKLEWGKLTDDDLEQINGRVDILVGTIQRRYGWTLDKAKEAVNDWLSRIKV